MQSLWRRPPEAFIGGLYIYIYICGSIPSRPGSLPARAKYTYVFHFLRAQDPFAPGAYKKNAAPVGYNAVIVQALLGIMQPLWSIMQPVVGYNAAAVGYNAAPVGYNAACGE